MNARKKRTDFSTAYDYFLMPILLYRTHCSVPSRQGLKKLDLLRKRTIRWILGILHFQGYYTDQLRLLNDLPLPLYWQLNDLLLLSKLCQDQSEHNIKIRFKNRVTNRISKVPDLTRICFLIRNSVNLT